MKIAPKVQAMSLILLLGMSSVLRAQATGAEAGAQQDKPAKPLTVRPVPSADDAAMQAAAAEAVRMNGLARINGMPYDKPSLHDTMMDYVRDSYGLPAFVRSLVRAAYAQARMKPTKWDDDGADGFFERLASSYGMTIISGNVRLAMELTFHEDLRYFPCIRCSVKAKIGNALLAEFTARHDDNGHRFFTLTPVVADFSGPIIAHSLWYPGGPDPFAGVVATRTVFATRVGAHLFQEFVWVKVHPPLRPQN